MANQQHQFQFTGSNLTSEQRYKQIIQAATTTVWLYLDGRTQDIPEDCNWDDLTPDQRHAVLDVLSVEEEWIIDEADRKECSMFTFDEEDAA